MSTEKPIAPAWRAISATLLLVPVAALFASARGLASPAPPDVQITEIDPGVYRTSPPHIHHSSSVKLSQTLAGRRRSRYYDRSRVPGVVAARAVSPALAGRKPAAATHPAENASDVVARRTPAPAPAPPATTAPATIAAEAPVNGPVDLAKTPVVPVRSAPALTDAAEARSVVDVLPQSPTKTAPRPPAPRLWGHAADH